jgi:hypothetical protein
MAASDVIVFKRALATFDGTNGIAGLTAANWRLALLDPDWVPDNDEAGNEVFANISADELPTGGGYTAGGIGVMDGDDVSWTASGGGIPAWRHGVIYYLGTVNTKVNPLFGYFRGNTAGDVAATAAGNPLNVIWNASGIARWTTPDMP